MIYYDFSKKSIKINKKKKTKPLITDVMCMVLKVETCILSDFRVRIKKIYSYEVQQN